MRIFGKALFGLLAVSAAVAGADIPYLSGRVNDYAGIMSEAARIALSDSLRIHEEKTGNQIAVLTIPTLNGQGIEEYATSVFNEWKLGKKDEDNGILILVIPQDRRMRIEVGYGLEGSLNDGKAGRIIRNVMTPRFKNNDYDGGITEGARAVMTVLGGGDPEGLDDESGDGGAMSGVEAPATHPAHPFRSLHFRNHRSFHLSRNCHSGLRMVPLFLPDPLLGIVPDRGPRVQGHSNFVAGLSGGISDGQVVTEQDGMVQESRKGFKHQGKCLSRRIQVLFRPVFRFLEFGRIQILRRFELFRRRRIVWRGRVVGELVTGG
jgi:hypothetical protein